MEVADPDILESRIKATLNAAKTFGGAITTRIRTASEISEARRAAATEVLRAIASYAAGPFYGEYVTYVPVEHNALLPAHEGDPGIPKIVPFPEADARDGDPAAVDQIDSFRVSPELFTGQNDGIPVPHNEADSEGRMSPLACRFNITANRLKFTGHSCEVPLFPQIDEDMTDNKIPLSLGPAVHKRAIPLLLKEGDNLSAIAREFGADGKQDLVEIAGGAMRVRPVRTVADVMKEQKEN